MFGIYQTFTNREKVNIQEMLQLAIMKINEACDTKGNCK